MMVKMLIRTVLVAVLANLAAASPVEPRLFQKPKTPVDAALYDKLVHYPAYSTVANILQSRSCSNPPYGSVVEKYFNNSQTDTQAAIFRADADKEIVLALPGTNGQEDYDRDFTFLPVPYVSPEVFCPLCLVHVGFLDAWNSIASNVEDELKTLIKSYPDYSLIITGVSLGGALAQLAFATIKAGGLPVKEAYTYGQPRVGNLAYAAYIDLLAGANDTEAGIYHRVTHSDDGVPSLPPIIVGGFFHSRTEYWESTDTPALNTTYRCYGQEPADCNDSAGGQFAGINAAHGGYAGLGYTCQA